MLHAAASEEKNERPYPGLGCTNLSMAVTWNVHESNLHLRFNWDLNLIDVCSTQSQSFNVFTFRCIDVVLYYKIASCMTDFIDRIYPTEHEIKGTTDTTRFASYYDLHLPNNWQRGPVKNATLRQKKWFHFPMVYFLRISSNIPAAHVYGIYMTRYVPFIVLTILSFFLLSLLIIGYSKWVTRLVQL